MAFILFSVYTAAGGVLTPKRVFTVLSLLIVLRLTTVHFMVQNALSMSEGLVAISRIGVSCMVRWQLHACRSIVKDNYITCFSYYTGMHMSATWHSSAPICITTILPNLLLQKLLSIEESMPSHSYLLEQGELLYLRILWLSIATCN